MSRLKQNMVFALLMALVGSASAVTVEFRNYSGDGLWGTAANWASNTLPTGADQAKHTFVDSALILQSTGVADELLVGYTVGSAVVDVVSGGDLMVNKINLGAYTAGAVGALYVNGGTLDAGSFLRVGNFAGTTGQFSMNSGMVSVGGTTAVGYTGEGSFVMSGGTFNANGVNGFRLGEQAGSTGTATIDGGLLSVPNGAIELLRGGAGSAIMNITGGSVVSKIIYINTSGGAGDAQLNLLGGSLEITLNQAWGLEIAGDDTLNIEGGTLLWAGNRVTDLSALISNNFITWDNGQGMLLETYDASWTNGSSVLYADYNTINPGKTTVWVEGTNESVDLNVLGYVVVTDYPGVQSDGTGDSTTGIQQAIDDAFALKKTVFFPAGTYLISDTLKCYRWQLWDAAKNQASNPTASYCHTLWGSAETGVRPVLKLTANASGFTNAGVPRPMISFRDFRALNSSANSPVEPAQPMEEPPHFGHAANIVFSDDLRGIDFDCNGNSGAIGIYFPAAQNSTIEDVRIDATGSYAGIWGVPGRNAGGMNIEVEGGQFGIIIRDSIGGTVLSGIRLFNQTGSALVVEDFVPTAIIGFHIVKGSGAVFTGWSKNWGTAWGSLCLMDGVVEMGSGDVVLDNTAGKNLYVRNVFVTGSDQLVKSPTGTTMGSGIWKRIKEYVFTNQSVPDSGPPYAVADAYFPSFNMIEGLTNRIAEPSIDVLNNSSAPPVDLVTRHIYANLPLYEGLSDGTINITQAPYYAVADDGINDHTAIQAAINAAESNGIGRVSFRLDILRLEVHSS